MKIYDKKPSGGFIHFMINLLFIIFLLWDISSTIGHDYISETHTMPTGLYKAIYSIECPDFDSAGIIEKLVAQYDLVEIGV